MKEIQFSIDINASKERVWETIWEDKTFRDWASIIDEGTYMKGVMKEGNEVQFISSVKGYYSGIQGLSLLNIVKLIKSNQNTIQ